MDLTTIPIETLKQKATRKHREYLEALRVEFKAKCNKVTEEAKAKFEAIPEDQKEERNKVLEEQKRQLDEILADLTEKIAKANHELLTVLESDAKREEKTEMDQLLLQIDNLDTK